MCQCKCDCKPVSKQNPNFQVGDVVRCNGVKGVVDRVSYIDAFDTFPLCVTFTDGSQTFSRRFTLDGRTYEYSTVKPSLTLVYRPKRKVTKTISRWLNVYPEGDFTVVWHSQQAANEGALLSKRIACVELTGTYEVEE